MKNQNGLGRTRFVVYCIFFVLMIGVSSYLVFGENGVLNRNDAELVINTTQSTENQVQQ